MNSTQIRDALPQSTASVRMVGVSRVHVQVTKSSLLKFYLGKLQGKQFFFFLVENAPVHLIGRDFLEAYEVQISFTHKGKMFLDLKGQSDFLHHIMFVIHAEGDVEQDKLPVST